MDSSPFLDFYNTLPYQITPEIEPKPIDDALLQPTQQPDLQSKNNRISELFRSMVPETVELNPNSTPIDPFQTHVPTTLSRAKDQQNLQSSQLLRVTQIRPNERRYLESFRKTRIIYNSLRVDAAFKHKDGNFPGNCHANSQAATLMKEKGLFLHPYTCLVGDVPGIAVGDIFMYRTEMRVLGLHGRPHAGIDYVVSNGKPIATSIVLSDEYEDNVDNGTVIEYAGQGGKDCKGQVKEDQKLKAGNLAMHMSMYYEVEVRVTRKVKYDGTPTGNVYVYDGLYRIVDTWIDIGKSGFRVYKFKLVRIENQEKMGSEVMNFAASLKGKQWDVGQFRYVSLDESGIKKIGVYFFNEIDNRHDPVCLNYPVKSLFPPSVYYSVGNSGCGCEGGCIKGCICIMKNGNEFPYDQNEILVKGKPLVFECGPHCRCPPSCQNRVAQKGIKNFFEVFRTKESRWGLRSLDLIQAGSFICEYVGLVLPREQARLLTMYGGDNLIYPGRFTERWREWGDLSKVLSDYVCPSYPSIPPLDFALEVSTTRNLACYIRHSTSPNVFVQLVLYDHNNVCFPHVMVFAMENIPPMKELCLDYGEAVANELKGKLDICS